MELQQPKPADLIQEEPKSGDAILCGACGLLNIVTPTGTRPISNEEILALSTEEQHDLAFAIRVIKAKVEQN